MIPIPGEELQAGWHKGSHTAWPEYGSTRPVHSLGKGKVLSDCMQRLIPRCNWMWLIDHKAAQQQASDWLA